MIGYISRAFSHADINQGYMDKWLNDSKMNGGKIVGYSCGQSFLAITLFIYPKEEIEKIVELTEPKKGPGRPKSNV